MSSSTINEKLLPTNSRPRFYSPHAYDSVSDSDKEGGEVTAAGRSRLHQEFRAGPSKPRIQTAKPEVVHSSRLIPEHRENASDGSDSRQSDSEDDKVDICVYPLIDGVCSDPEHPLKTLGDIDRFFNSRQPSLYKKDYLLLIEDISESAIKTIEANIRPTDFGKLVAAEYVRGRVNKEKFVQRKLLHANRVQTSLFDRYTRKDDQESLTWWKLFSHSRDGYAREMNALRRCEADISKIVVPYFDAPTSDTRQNTTGSANQSLRGMDIAHALREEWNDVRRKAGEKISETKELLRLDKSPKTYMLDSHTYRPHQVITEAQEDTWGVAAEERVTFICFEDMGTTYFVVLFDKPRGFRENPQTVISTEDNNGDSVPVGKPELTKTVGHPVPAFLTEDPDESKSSAETNSLKRSRRPGRRKRVKSLLTKLMITSENQTSEDPSSEKPPSPQTQHIRTDVKEEEHTTAADKLPQQKPDFPKSTRELFTENLGDLSFHPNAPTENQEDSMRVAVRRMLAKMAATDWDLVLSQMAKTLDEIDSKLSDRTLLEANAFAWMRLLISWRVIQVEFSGRLEEAKKNLMTFSTTILSPRRITPSQSPFFSPTSPTANPTDSQSVELEPQDQQLFDQYTILMNGLIEVKDRAEKTFGVITSSMSILESERTIHQGMVINRLTELAFFFIPLSFAATFYSMQVRDFDGDKKPTLGYFFGTGIGLLLAMYTMRVIIRSAALARFKRAAKEKIRKTNSVPGTEEIPGRLIVSFMWHQLGAASQIALLVLPFAILILVIILVVSDDDMYKFVGVTSLVLGVCMVALCFIVKQMVGAIQSALFTVWWLSMLSICVDGRKLENRLDLGQKGAICTAVTTVCIVILALIPQNIVSKVWKAVAQVLVPLWIVVLPFTILLHYYNVYHWEPYRLILGLVSLLVIYALTSFALYEKHYQKLVLIVGLFAVVCGIPLTFAWTVWPNYEETSGDNPSTGVYLPLDIRIAITTFSGTLFLILAPTVFHTRYRSRHIWWCLACFIIVLALPITMVWYFMPYHGYPLPLYAKVIVSVGTVLLWCLICIFTRRTNVGKRISFLCIATVIVVLPVAFAWFATPQPNMQDLSMQAKISVTLGSVLVLGLVVRALPPFNGEGWRVLSWLMTGVSVMLGIPLYIWVTDWKAFEEVRKSRNTMIHLTWASILPLFIIWIVLWRYAFSTGGTWLPRIKRKKMEGEPDFRSVRTEEEVM